MIPMFVTAIAMVCIIAHHAIVALEQPAQRVGRSVQAGALSIGFVIVVVGMVQAYS